MTWIVMLMIALSGVNATQNTPKTKEYIITVKIQQPKLMPLDTVRSYRLTTELISLLKRKTVWFELERFNPKHGGLFASLWTYHLNLEDDSESVRIFAPGVGIRKYGKKRFGSFWAPYFGAGVEFITYKYQHHPTKVNIAPTLNFGQAANLGSLFALAGGVLRAEMVGKGVLWDFLLIFQAGVRFQ